MKKIIFSDRYGLTQAVLEGRKTQTRRILYPTMLFRRMKTFEGWSEEDIGSWKASCMKRLYAAQGEELQQMLDCALQHSQYKLGETIAIAQKYDDLVKDDEFYRLCGIHGMPLECIKYEKGCTNKMFVRADLMPHHIRITRIRVERLQDISDEDCLEEGIWTRSGRTAYGRTSRRDYGHGFDGVHSEDILQEVALMACTQTQRQHGQRKACQVLRRGT